MHTPEHLLTIQQAAEVLHIHVWQLRRAIKRGAIPSYQPFNTRKLVRLSEVEAAIYATRQGGKNV
jgi:excisionase family DNA binding protein